MKKSLTKIQENTVLKDFQKIQTALLKNGADQFYKIIFNFLSQSLHVHGASFYWKETGSRLKKQSFFSNKKTTQSVFLKIQKKIKKSKFPKSGLIVEKDFLCLKIKSYKRGEFFYIYGEKPKKDVSEALLSIILRDFKFWVLSADKIMNIQSLNFIDDVTGLYNQRYLSVLLDKEIEKFKRSKAPFSVLFVDVDHFKNVNDHNGHLVGSDTLKEIGRIIKGSVRSIDFCFRYGGDEFIVILTNTSEKHAFLVAQRICQTIEKTSFLIRGKTIKTTLSIGVACFPKHAKSKEEIIHVADEAMYSGKKISRNVVYVAS